MDWWIWMVGGLVLLGLEMVVPGGLFMLFFGFGAIFVGTLTAFNFAGDQAWQWITWSASSLVFLFLFRKRMLAYWQLKGQTNSTSDIVGETAIADSQISPLETGKVELRGTTWTAVNSGTKIISQGQRCKVISITGLTLNVE